MLTPHWAYEHFISAGRQAVCSPVISGGSPAAGVPRPHRPSAPPAGRSADRVTSRPAHRDPRCCCGSSSRWGWRHPACPPSHHGRQHDAGARQVGATRIVTFRSGAADLLAPVGWVIKLPCSWAGDLPGVPVHPPHPTSGRLRASGVRPPAHHWSVRGEVHVNLDGLQADDIRRALLAPPGEPASRRRRRTRTPRSAFLESSVRADEPSGSGCERFYPLASRTTSWRDLATVNGLASLRGCRRGLPRRHHPPSGRARGQALLADGNAFRRRAISSNARRGQWRLARHAGPGGRSYPGFRNQPVLPGDAGSAHVSWSRTRGFTS